MFPRVLQRTRAVADSCCTSFRLIHLYSSVNPAAALNQAGIFISIVLADQGTHAQLVAHALPLLFGRSAMNWALQLTFNSFFLVLS